LIALALKHNGLASLLTGTAIFGGILMLGLLFVSFGVQKHEKDASTAPAASLQSDWSHDCAGRMFFIM